MYMIVNRNSHLNLSSSWECAWEQVEFDWWISSWRSYSVDSDFQQTSEAGKYSVITSSQVIFSSSLLFLRQSRKPVCCVALHISSCPPVCVISPAFFFFSHEINYSSWPLWLTNLIDTTMTARGPLLHPSSVFTSVMCDLSIIFSFLSYLHLSSKWRGGWNENEDWSWRWDENPKDDVVT